MCEAENCMKVRELKQIAEGIDTSCIYTSGAPERTYGSGNYASLAYGSQQISY
jgi:hypothetical protein